METIKLQNGSVITKSGAVSCSCCLDIDIVFGSFGDCDCSTVQCYNATTNPSPSFVFAGGSTFNNSTPGTNRFTAQGIAVQSPLLPDGVTIGPWNNIVSGPSVMRLTGNVGGDVAVTARRFGEDSSSVPESIPDFIQTIPHLGEYPCGICATAANGVHPVDFTFLLAPFMLLVVEPVTFIECFPWLRLNLTTVGSA